MRKPLTVWIKQTEKFLKWWENQTTLTTSCKTCMQVKKQQNWTMKQQTDSKLEQEYLKAVCSHLVQSDK